MRFRYKHLVYLLLVFAVLIPSAYVPNTQPNGFRFQSSPVARVQAGMASLGQEWNFWQWLTELTILKRNFLQELIGSITDRFAMVQGVYAAAPHVAALYPASTTRDTVGGTPASAATSANYSQGKLGITSTGSTSDPTTTDTIGGTTSVGGDGSSTIYGFLIVASASGVLQTIGINLQTGGHNRVAIYSTDGGTLSGLLAQSADVVAAAGWNDISVPAVNIVGGTAYYIAIQSDSATRVYYTATGTRVHVAFTYGSFPDPTGAVTTDTYSWNMRIKYSTGPPASDFTITATTPSQTVGAGATATYTLQITYSATLTATVNLAVTSGCPAGVTCMVSPSSVTGSGPMTLSVPTLVTTPGGTTTVTVTASSTSPALSHSVSVQLTVNSPGSYGVNVHAGATQVVVTVSWAGAGTAAVTLAGPGGSPTLSESGAIVYDRVTYVSGSSSPNNIHRVTFTITPPPSAQAWTVLVSLSGSYTVTIEVS